MKKSIKNDINEIANIFHLLGDKSRLTIFLLLSSEEKTVTQIVKYTSLTQSNVSHHLSLLKKSGLVISRRNGKSVYYRAVKNDMICKLFKINNIEI